MAKRKKQSSKVQKKKGVRAHPKAKKAAGKATKRTVKAKHKRAAAKKDAPPIAAVETVATEVIEPSAPA